MSINYAHVENGKYCESCHRLFLTDTSVTNTNANTLDWYKYITESKKKEFIFVTEKQSEIASRVAIRKSDISVVVEEKVLNENCEEVHARTQIILQSEEHYVFALETFDDIMKQMEEA